MNTRVLPILAAVVAMVILSAGTASATPFAILNSSFEDNPNAVGYWTTQYNAAAGMAGTGVTDTVADGVQQNYYMGWTPAYDSNSSVKSAYSYGFERNPTSAEFATAGGNGTLPGTADGSQCLYNGSKAKVGGVLQYVDNDICMIMWPQYYGMYTNWAPLLVGSGRTYTMTIAVGRGLTDPLGWFGGFSMLINAETASLDGDGGNIKNVEFASSENPDPGTFKDFTITWTDADAIAAGFSVGDYFVPAFIFGTGTYVDNVRIDVSDVPEPSTLVLVVSGLIGLLAYAWRKRK